MNRFFRLIVGTAMLAAAAMTANAEEIVFRVRNQALHGIDDRLFGQFMEIASGDYEIGAEGAVAPDTKKLQPRVLQLIREMEIPVIRYPGGIDVDYLDWRDRIDHVPGRAGGRPLSLNPHGRRITNHFGYDEFLRMIEDIDSEAIVVVNFGDGLLKKKPLDEAATLAAGLVAYCNAPVGAKLPDGMPDWPAIRARNGHPKPYGVKLWQIGNEVWQHYEEENLTVKDTKFHAESLATYARAMLAVDPTIELIICGKGDTFPAAKLTLEMVGGEIRYLVTHPYTPLGMRSVERDGKQVAFESLSAEEIWNCWVAAPDIDEDGNSTFHQPLLETARRDGFKVAATEWNWNGWLPSSLKPRPQLTLDSVFARGIGAAGFLHAMMRYGDVIEIGCQSMLVGTAWPINAIRADRDGKQMPYYHPSGQATMLYTQHHGDRLLAMETAGVPSYAQPYRMGRLQPQAKVACLDALATADEKSVYIHVINRDFKRDLTVRIDVSDLGPMIEKADIYRLEGRLNDIPKDGEPRQVGRIVHTEMTYDGEALRVTLPGRTVTCIELPRKAGNGG